MRAREQGERCEDCPLAGPGQIFDFLLDPEYSELVMRHSQLHTYREGQVIVAEGQPIDGWYILRNGAARIYTSDPDGHERTVRFAQPGDLLGGFAADSLGESHDHCYSAVALGDGVEVCRFDSRSQARLFAACPALASAFLGLMVRQLAYSYRRLHNLSTTTASSRLVDALVRLADAHRPPAGPPRGTGQGKIEEKPEPVSLNLSRQQLADILGVTRETAVRAQDLPAHGSSRPGSYSSPPSLL